MMVVVVLHCFIFFFFKQKTAYEMSISDWSSTCALPILGRCGANLGEQVRLAKGRGTGECHHMLREHVERAGAKAVGVALARLHGVQGRPRLQIFEAVAGHDQRARSEEHTSELQSLMRISYAVFCLKKKKRELEIKLLDTK